MPKINKSAVLNQLQSDISNLTVSTEETEALLLFLKTALNSDAVDAENIKTELANRIAAITTSNSVFDLAHLVKSVELITKNRRISVPELSDLVDLGSGSVAFVESVGETYIQFRDGRWGPLFRSDSFGLNAYAWGSNSSGQLGDNTLAAKSSPVNVAGNFGDWIQVSASEEYSLGLRANGTLWAWGNNDNGRLGDGTTISRTSPVSVLGGFTDWVQVSGNGSHSSNSSLGVRANGTLWAWGNNSYGKLGDNTTVGKSSPVSVVGGFTDWVQASAGSVHSLGLRANGTLWAWGRNDFGALGDNTVVDKSSPVLVAGGFTDWVQVSAGRNNAIGLRANGSLWSWGANTVGQLGDNTTTNRSSPVTVVGGFTDWIQASINAHCLAIRADGTLWVWGEGQFGKLGDNTVVNKSSPVSVLGGFTDWVQVSTAQSSSLAVRANGTLWSWGVGDALGDNTTVTKSSPVSVVGGFTDWVQVSVGAAISGSHALGVRGG
jgi:alpha-tubulin suppressor-like RCC1 family protein